MEGNKNNFDFLRLLFASLVIVSHSYPLSGNGEILYTLTRQLTLGEISVDCFFIMSGYLVFTSLKTSSTFSNYLWKRFLRLFPALIVLVVFTLFLLPLLYGSIHIFHEKTYWTYGFNVLTLYRVQDKVNGIFEHNPYPKTINGSLWSLCYEFTMYIALAVLFVIRRKPYVKYLLLLAFASVTALYLFAPNALHIYFAKILLDSRQLYHLAIYFIAGSLLCFINLKKINLPYIRWLLFGILVISMVAGVFKYVSLFVLPLFISLIGIHSTPYLNQIREKIGDLSYGAYIYGFLVQQCLMNYFPLHVGALMTLSLIIAFGLAYLSWHCVEKKMLRYKNLF